MTPTQNNNANTKIKKIVIPLEPRGQRRARSGKGFTYKDKIQSEREKTIMYYLDKARPEKPISGPVFLGITAFFRRPKSHYGSKSKEPYLKPDAPLWCPKKPDYDNVAKMITDCMNEMFFDDDCQVCFSVIRKQYSESPRWELKILEMRLTEDINFSSLSP